jgi:Transcriptional regulators
MDSIDYEIVKHLQEDGRIPVKKLAEIVSLTPPAVTERIKKLENSGVIKGYKAIVDPSKLGKKIKAIINLTLKNDTRKELIAFVKENKCILECNLVTGSFSASMNAIFEDISELDTLVSNMLKFGNTHTLIIISSPVENKPIL